MRVVRVASWCWGRVSARGARGLVCPERVKSTLRRNESALVDALCEAAADGNETVVHHLILAGVCRLASDRALAAAAACRQRGVAKLLIAAGSRTSEAAALLNADENFEAARWVRCVCE